MAHLDQALDIAYGTLQDIRRKTPPLTYAYSTYMFWNSFWKGAVKTVGDQLEGYITLDSEGNARHSGWWDDDSTVKKNINKKFTADWVHAEGSMAWNLIEMDINSSPARIYNAWEQQYNACCRDIVEHMFPILFTGQTSSSDVDRPMGIGSILTLGTDGSTGGWTGYSGHYNDGSTPGATFNRYGIASSASSNSRWASWYADHDGDLDDSLLTILDGATMDLNFQAPTVPDGLPIDKCQFALYTTKNVRQKLNLFYAKSDDNMGYRPRDHFGVPSFNGIPMVYVPPLDTANVSIYGTDPIFGINHKLLYPVVLKGWNFKITKRPDSNKHNVMTLFMDIVYQLWCENPRHAGFCISQQ
jgi:hypothetical protein